MNLLIYISLFIGVVLSGLSVFLFNVNQNKNIKLLLSFSASYLLAITFLHLIPEIYLENKSSIGIYILLGFFLQILLELFSEGIEHGHAHLHHENNFPFPLAMMISLCIHSFLEGMPLVSSENQSSTNPLLMGIIFHNIPISIVLMTLFLKSKISKTNAILLLILFALMSPLGAFSSYMIGNNFTNNISNYSDKTLAIVVGIFLHVATTILFESTENHRFNIYKFITILLGAGVAFISL